MSQEYVKKNKNRKEELWYDLVFYVYFFSKIEFNFFLTEVCIKMDIWFAWTEQSVDKQGQYCCKDKDKGVFF